MYILDNCIERPNGVVESLHTNMCCATHYQMLAYALKHVYRGFKEINKRDSKKLARLLHYSDSVCEVVSQVTSECIYDMYGNALFDISHLNTIHFHIERCVLDRQNNIVKIETFKGCKNKYNSGTDTGVHLLAETIIFQNGIPKNPKHHKEAYMYDKGGQLLYKVNSKGIYDNKDKLLLDFSLFFQSKSIPKRLRNFTYKDKIL